MRVADFYFPKRKSGLWMDVVLDLRRKYMLLCGLVLFRCLLHFRLYLSGHGYLADHTPLQPKPFCL